MWGEQTIDLSLKNVLAKADKNRKPIIFHRTA